MTFLTKQQILEANDIEYEIVDVEEWGGSVRVNGLNAFQRDKFEASIVEQRGKKMEVNSTNIRAKLLAWTLADEEGNLLFSEKDVRSLGQKSGAVVSKLFDIARRLSGMTNEDVDELVGNLENDQDES